MRLCLADRMPMRVPSSALADPQIDARIVQFHKEQAKLRLEARKAAKACVQSSRATFEWVGG